jgi:hypothetical protein
MRKPVKKKAQAAATVSNSVFTVRAVDDPFLIAESEAHVFRGSKVCATDHKGYATPQNRSPLDLAIDASDGFIPLWDKELRLHWRFNEASLKHFQDPSAAQAEIRRLFSLAVMEWGDSAPVKFTERKDDWDFEIVVRKSDDCDENGCTLASAFFPDAGRHQLLIYPKMFAQDETEQKETLIHEIGHMFGLRHFFANITETQWASVIYGDHDPFSIMNYGHMSELSNTDKRDLKELYQRVWSGELKEINGTKIVKVKPFHMLAAKD